MKQKIITLLLVLVYLVSLLSLYFVNALPEGASITNTSSSERNTTAATSRQDPKGTITTLVISTIQQNRKWKAYIGNVSGQLVLRDADEYNIYAWTSASSPTGQVFLTRNDTIDWDTIQCANITNVETEQSTLGHAAAASDNINLTFSNYIHKTFVVHETTIQNSTCKSLATWINDSSQTLTENSSYQEVMLMDSSLRIVYATMIDQDISNYRNDTDNSTGNPNATSDFQVIVPDYVTSTIATYYFYVEIDA